jgi:hypothetical protein
MQREDSKIACVIEVVEMKAPEMRRVRSRPRTRSRFAEEGKTSRYYLGGTFDGARVFGKLAQ